MKPAPSAAVRADTQQATHPQQALSRLLDELLSVLLQVSPGVYTSKPFPQVSGSIGEHVRHILDHVAAFVSARAHGVLTYDQRERGTAIERDTGAALQAILRLKASVAEMDDAMLDSPVAVMTILQRGESATVGWSTLQRELAFVVNHTVHHQALIAVLLAVRGDEVPELFGFASSTPPPASS